MMRTVHGDHARFKETYFSTYPGMYFTGDGCRRDADGFYWITAASIRAHVSGHRMGTAEIEWRWSPIPRSRGRGGGYPHAVKGQGIYCYVTLMDGETPRMNCAPS